MRYLLLFASTICFLLNSGCVSSPKFKTELVTPWDSKLDGQSPSRRPFIAYHKKGSYRLFYLAAHHGNDLQNDTMQLVERLFSKFQFNAIIIEPIPNSYGVSPNWYVEEARQGKNANFIRGGESSLVAIRADEKKIPFFGGEIDHKQLFDRLKEQGFSNEDVLGFYLARQIPQWIRENENKNEIVDKKGPQFINHYCKTFEIEPIQCPEILKLKSWYKEKNGKTLDSSVSTEDVAPLKNSPLFTHKISSAIGTIRDRFTLEIIQDALKKYERVAVVYGGSHYMTLKKSIEDELGEAQNIVTPETPLIRYVDSNSDENFKIMVDNSIIDLLDFSELEDLGIRSVSSFVKEVVLYGSKASFDKMISSSPNWPKGGPVPPNYVGVGEKGVFHVVSWDVYKQIHPTESISDYRKLLTHELGHLLHIAVLKDKEDEMGPIWFFEGLACLMANQYLDAKLPDHLKIKSIMQNKQRGNYQEYVALVRALRKNKSIKGLIERAKDKNFTEQSQKYLERH